MHWVSFLVGRLQKKLLESVGTEPLRPIIKPYVAGVVQLQSRSTKLVERFKDLYKTDRVEVMDSLRERADSDSNERLVYCIVEVTLNSLSLDP